MYLSEPIHALKSKAKKLKKETGITSVQALDQIARQEGFNSWSLLSSRKDLFFPQCYNDILNYFNNGDVVLIGARPGLGKTTFTIGLFVKAIQKMTIPNYFFSLSEIHNDVVKRINYYDKDLIPDNKFFILNYSNDISADYIIRFTENTVKEGSLIIIDYLQLLDEKRKNPPLQKQMENLKQYAKDKKCIIILISQISRELEYKKEKIPTIKDIRLPNPLDLSLINKILLLYRKTKNSKTAEVYLNTNPEKSFIVNYSKEKKIFY